jgi:hypothetical protein
VQFNEDTDEWKCHASMKLSNFDIDDESVFKTIWFTKKEPALIFEPRKKLGKSTTEHKKGMCYIKLDLPTKRFTRTSRKQFEKQKHSALNKNGRWSLLSPGSDPLEVDDSGHSLPGDTRCEDQSPLHSPRLEGLGIESP